MKPNVVKVAPPNPDIATAEEQERAASISSQFKVKEAPPPRGTVGGDDSLRGRILQLSLFPNIYNKRR